MLSNVFICFVLSTSAFASVIVEPQALAGVEFPSVAFKSGPQVASSIANVSLTWLKPASRGFECKDATLGVTAPLDSDYSALVIVTDIKRCMPEFSANAAKANGFSMLIYLSPYRKAGCAAQNTWIWNGATIPILEVPSTSLEAFAASRVDIVLTENKYVQMSTIGPMIPFYFIIAALSLLKLFVCSRAIMGQWETFKADKYQMSAAQFILMIEATASMNALLSCVDFSGLFHLVPFPVWYGFLANNSLFTVMANYFLSLELIKIEALISGRGEEKLKIWTLHGIAALFFTSNYACLCCIVFQIYFNNAIASYPGVSVSIAELFFSAFFIMKKRKLISVMKQANQGGMAGSDNVISHKREMERMTHYLFVSGVLSSIFIVVSLISGVSIALGSCELLISSQILSSLANTIIGMAQIMSLPNRITGISLRGFSSQATSRNTKDGRKSSKGELGKLAQSDPVQNSQSLRKSSLNVDSIVLSPDTPQGSESLMKASGPNLAPVVDSFLKTSPSP